MKPDSLEQKLARQQMRQVPPEWRVEVLIAARQAQNPRQPSPTARHSFFSTLNQQLATLLWPNPRAWGALATVWVVILTANMASRGDSATATARRVAPPTPEMRELLREQEQLFAELFDQPAIERPKTSRPQPQSLHRSEHLDA